MVRSSAAKSIGSGLAATGVGDWAASAATRNGRKTPRTRVVFMAGPRYHRAGRRIVSAAASLDARDGEHVLERDRAAHRLVEAVLQQAAVAGFDCELLHLGVGRAPRD